MSFVLKEQNVYLALKTSLNKKISHKVFLSELLLGSLFLHVMIEEDNRCFVQGECRSQSLSSVFLFSLGTVAF